MLRGLSPFFFAVLVVLPTIHGPGLEAGEPKAKRLTKTDGLTTRDGLFYLDGEPFAEISFNKFDLLWQLYDQLVAGNPLTDTNPLVRAQDKALQDLHEMGFRSIRFFALPWGPAGPESYADPGKRRLLYAALDKALELCDKHDIRVVWSLASGAFTDTRIVPGKGWVHGREHQRELMADRESRGRRLLYRYIDETVGRYKHRKAVLLWEVGNEITLSADIGTAEERIYEGERMPTLKDVAGFWNDVAGRIKAVDPRRLVNSGGSAMRESQWNLYRERTWKKDTFEEQFQCFDLLYANSAVDVVDVHAYTNNRSGYVISDGEGGDLLLDFRGWMAIAQRLDKPLLIGELGLHPIPKTDARVWKETPDYFDSYADAAAAAPWVDRTLERVIDAGVQIAYWWCYQSDRPVDQTDPQRFDLTRERNPELVRRIVAANQRLRGRLPR